MQNMKTVTVKPNQTIFDLAAQHCGTCGAIGEILSNNPALANDDAAKVALGIDPLADRDFYPDLPVRTGSTIRIDTDSLQIRSTIVREIQTDITTFNL